jgi:hypothetical protein
MTIQEKNELYELSKIVFRKEYHNLLYQEKHFLIIWLLLSRNQSINRKLN